MNSVVSVVVFVFNVIVVVGCFAAAAATAAGFGDFSLFGASPQPFPYLSHKMPIKAHQLSLWVELFDCESSNLLRPSLFFDCAKM